MPNCSQAIGMLKEEIDRADAVVVGAGAGLSAAAGLAYSGRRFERHFADFIEKYHFQDMYSAGFYPYSTQEEYWAYWSRHILLNRFEAGGGPVYAKLLEALKDKDYFVITTNVDHCFQKAGFDKRRLFYTQGDYGLWQCRKPCHQKTYDNEQTVRRMVAEQKDMRIPTALVPHCPKCGRPMAMNLRCDNTFVEDEGWELAAKRYAEFIQQKGQGRVLYWELGVGGNTPGIIKYPFWSMVMQNTKAAYACVNMDAAAAPREIADRSLCIQQDIGAVLERL